MHNNVNCLVYENKNHTVYVSAKATLLIIPPLQIGQHL